MKTTLKIVPSPNFFLPLPPPNLKKYYLTFFMTSHLDSHGTTDIKPEMLSGVQTRNGTPHDKYNIHCIAHARTNRKDFYAKKTCAKLYIYIRVGAYSRYLFPACCLLRKKHL